MKLQNQEMFSLAVTEHDSPKCLEVESWTQTFEKRSSRSPAAQLCMLQLVMKNEMPRFVVPVTQLSYGKCISFQFMALITDNVGNEAYMQIQASYIPQ